MYTYIWDEFYFWHWSFSDSIRFTDMSQVQKVRENNRTLRTHHFMKCWVLFFALPVLDKTLKIFTLLCKIFAFDEKIFQFLESQKFSPETRNLCKNISKERRDNNKDCETGQKDNSVLIGSWIVANEFHEHKCENILPKLGVKSCLKPINQTMIHNLDSKPRRLSNFRSHKIWSGHLLG